MRLVYLVPATATLIVNTLTRRIGINLGLLGLVSGLVALVLFEPGRKQPVAIPPLLNLTMEDIQQIKVERLDQEILAFERHAEHWWMIAPNRGLANPVLIHAILHLVEVRCPLRYAVAGLDLKPLGFEPPRLQLQLNDHTLYFGGTAPTDGQRYLQSGTTVYLCPDRFYPLLTSAAASFLAPSIAPSTSNTSNTTGHE